MADYLNNDQSVNIDDELYQLDPAENILQNCSQIEPQQETNCFVIQECQIAFKNPMTIN